MFTIGPTTNTSLPNFPRDNVFEGMSDIAINQVDFVESPSLLKLDDVVQKISVFFSANKNSAVKQLFVDEFVYGLHPVPILLEKGDCSTLF